MVAALPLACLLFPLVRTRAAIRGPRSIHILATEGEFGPFVHLLEYLRKELPSLTKNDLVMVLSRRRHAFCALYESELGIPIMTGHKFWIFVQQAILLQTSRSVVVRRLTNAAEGTLPTTPVRITQELLAEKNEILARLKIKEHQMVLMSVNVRSYDVENNPQYLSKELALESIGSELAPALDFLESRHIPVMLVGSRDSGRSTIPRDIPRLDALGKLGGPEEVALASICRYFWTDNVGAWWLTAPFKRPVLFTNFARFKIRRGLVSPGSLFLPTRYERHDGTRVTFRDILGQKSSPYKAASRGELRIIRNSPDEIVEAHEEMLARLDGSWSETDESESLLSCYTQLMAEFPAFEPWRIPTAFLAKHPYLLD